MIGIDLWTDKSCAVCLLDGTYYIVPKTDAHALDKEKTFTQKLSYCRYAAQEWLEAPVQGAVITVPDGFDLLQRQAVLDAGKAAGSGCWASPPPPRWFGDAARHGRERRPFSSPAP